MEVDKDDFGLDFLEQRVDRSKRIFLACHKGPALQIHDRIRLSRSQRALVNTVSWRTGNVVSRAQYSPRTIMAVRRNGLHIFDDFAFVPDMVTGCQDMGSLVEELVGNPGSYPETAGRVFRVDYHQIPPPMLDKGGQMLRNDTASGLAKNVTNKENSQKTASKQASSANDPATSTK